MTYAERTLHLKAEGAYQVLTKANQLEATGRKIVHFEIGQPDFDTFANVSMAGIRAICEGQTRSTSPSGSHR
jgi:aspartate/methionine/tyrosine aminotransferase